MPVLTGPGVLAGPGPLHAVPSPAARHRRGPADRGPDTTAARAEALARSGHGGAALDLLDEVGADPSATDATARDARALRTLVRGEHPGERGAPRAPAAGDWGRALAEGPVRAAADAWAGVLAGLPAYEIAPRATHALAALSPPSQPSPQPPPSFRDPGGPWSATVAAAAIRALLHTDRLAAAAGWSGRLAARAEEDGASERQAEFLTLLAVAEYRQGELSAARGHLATALGLVPGGDAQPWRLTALLTRGRVLALTGRPPAPGHTAAPVPVPVHTPQPRHADAVPRAPSPNSLQWVDHLYFRGETRLARGRPAEALMDFVRCGRALRDWGADRPTVTPWRSGAARAHLALGNRGPALALALAEVRLARECAAPRTLGISLREAAVAADPLFRMDLLQESARTHETAGARLELARTLALIGRERHRTGDRKAARAVLSTACEAAHACGAAALEKRVRQELAAAGGRVCGKAVRDSRTLTARQQRVAELAVQGYGNREIAARLSLTESTVEQHMTQIYRKLDIGKRSEIKISGETLG
ncbi:LuxR C-terminal-related transcriptional regulator [Streptomyces sp. JV176]|uniref:LuxR C-terminal-related transcriptional regulator n=1 Tax=Streptomyces sp. JV176 TaxID=858630 RepID=UPI002E799346|nr:LuxR C-terminal-related transcriptional regulator [Streptomyces sp. JV176]MEE1803275.1 LuxR C-terminal-related transcriptional regulator [Streptomyces sp. JV176]